MAITVESIRQAVEVAQACFTDAEAELNAADAKLGDGDTGGMLKRLADSLAAADLAAATDPGTAFTQLARAASESTGSSLGTLVMTALMAFAKGTRGEVEVDLDRLPELVGSARDAMLARGGASIGDKTVVDGLSAVADALAGAAPPNYAKVAAQASRAALGSFRDRPNRIGRARLYGDRSLGLDDPGMLALTLLCNALDTRPPAQPAANRKDMP